MGRCMQHTFMMSSWLRRKEEWPNTSSFSRDSSRVRSASGASHGSEPGRGRNSVAVARTQSPRRIQGTPPPNTHTHTCARVRWRERARCGCRDPIALRRRLR